MAWIGVASTRSRVAEKISARHDMPGRRFTPFVSVSLIFTAKLKPWRPSATFADTAIEPTEPSTAISGNAIANTRARSPGSMLAMSASSTLTSASMVSGFAMVMRFEPGMLVELEIAVSPTLMSSDVTVPSSGA